MAIADLQKRGRSWLVSLLLIGLGVVVGYALPASSVSPKSEVGTILSSAAKAAGPSTSFVFKAKAGARQTFRFVNSTPWQATSGGKWNHLGVPPCLTSPSGKPNSVTVGVVNIHSVDSAPGQTMVAWLECYG
jgi:hypothetical protein